VIKLQSQLKTLDQKITTFYKKKISLIDQIEERKKESKRSSAIIGPANNMQNVTVNVGDL